MVCLFIKLLAMSKKGSVGLYRLEFELIVKILFISTKRSNLSNASPNVYINEDSVQIFLQMVFTFINNPSISSLSRTKSTVFGNVFITIGAILYSFRSSTFALNIRFDTTSCFT